MTTGLSAHSETPRGSRWSVSRTQAILIAMVVGIAIGAVFPDSRAGVFHATDLQVLSNIFLRLVKTLIAPLLLSTLIVGIAGHGDDMARVGKLAFRSMVYFEVVTTLALVVGLVVVNVVKPGVGVNLALASAETGARMAQTKSSLAGILEHAVPQSLFDAAARNDALQITVFAIIFGVALARVKGPRQTFMLELCEGLADVMFKFVGIVMAFAPIGIGAAIAATVGQSGIGVLRGLGLLVLTLYAALVVFALVVLLPIALAFRIPVGRFIDAVRQPWLIAFSTASSEAALPTALENMERFGVPRRIVSFVLPAGYAFNLDGSTLYFALASVFVAQAAGVDMPISQQIMMMLTLMVTSKGVAGVPRVGLVVIAATLAQFGLPLQGVAVILGVDAFMDMARTSVNVTGNCLASAVMARWEGELAVQPAADSASLRSMTMTPSTTAPGMK